MSVKYEVLLIFVFLLFPVFFTTQVFEYSIDEYMESDERCFWHIMCNLSKPLLFKECLDAVHEDLIIDMKEEFSPKLPEDINEMTTMENIRSDTFWVETLTPLLCAYPEDLKKKYVSELNLDFIKYVHVLCRKEGNAEKCVTFEKAAEIYGILQGKMVEAGECDIANFNKPEWFKSS